MLEKFIALERVGIFQSGAPKALTLRKVTLVYADNARGKSTLSAVLHSCATGDAAPLTARTTFGAQGTPRVVMRFALPTSATNITLENGKWDNVAPHVVVFDQGFVERNVYAGSEVRPEHHQGLLDFAVGSKAVAKKHEVEQHGAAQLAATKARTAAEDKLTGYRDQMPLAAFLALGKVDAADQKIADYEKRITNAKASTTLQARADLKPLTWTTPDLASFEEVLKSSFEQLHENVQTAVKTHFDKHGGAVVEAWVRSGRELHDGKSCPFCGQKTMGLDLIESYKAYFNAEYAAHISKVQTLCATAAKTFPAASIATWEQAWQANADRAAAWSGELEFDHLALDFESFRNHAETIQAQLTGAAQAKEKSPLSVVDSAPVEDARADLAEVESALAAYNLAIAKVNASIAAFKMGLANEDLKKLEGAVRLVQSQKRRHSTEVETIVTERTKADDARSKAEQAKVEGRAELDGLMNEVLKKFRNGINKRLAVFGAPFSIEHIKASYQGGGAPRTDYRIALRGKVVAAGKKSATEPCFQNVLSDGDKRALALAFFLARVLDDKDAGGFVVVLDDVFASLDRHRRSATASAICDLAAKCAQVIVLGHDAHFLREVNKRVRRKGIADTLTLELRRAADDFSVLAECDLEALCASDYQQRYGELAAFLAAAPGIKPLSVAENLRTLVEGNLHRRFPGLINEGSNFGAILDLVKNAAADHPFAVLQPQLKALQAFNDFAGAFHHDTAGGAVRNEVSEVELLTFGKQAIRFVHEGVMA